MGTISLLLPLVTIVAVVVFLGLLRRKYTEAILRKQIPIYEEVDYTENLPSRNNNNITHEVGDDARDGKGLAVSSDNSPVATEACILSQQHIYESIPDIEEKSVTDPLLQVPLKSRNSQSWDSNEVKIFDASHEVSSGTPDQLSYYSGILESSTGIQKQSQNLDAQAHDESATLISSSGISSFDKICQISDPVPNVNYESTMFGTSDKADEVNKAVPEPDIENLYERAQTYEQVQTYERVPDIDILQLQRNASISTHSTCEESVYERAQIYEIAQMYERVPNVDSVLFNVTRNHNRSILFMDTNVSKFTAKIPLAIYLKHTQSRTEG